MEAIPVETTIGALWRDIPEELCSWETAYSRFNRWSKTGLWENFFLASRKEIDTEWVFTDGSYVRCHQHASGARRGADRAIGRSRGGATTKIHLSCDADGYPLDFKNHGGDVHDSQVAGELIDMIGQADCFIADKGYDSEAIRDKARSHNMIPLMPKGRIQNSLIQNLIATCRSCVILLKMFCKA